MSIEGNIPWSTQDPSEEIDSADVGLWPQPMQAPGSALPAEPEPSTLGAMHGASESAAQTAVQGTKDVVKEAATQAAAVTGTAKEQFGHVVGQAKDELRSQMEARGAQVTSGLQTISNQLLALKDGRPEEAGHVGTLVGEAQNRVQSYMGTLQQRGPQAFLDDLGGFARRRPGRFIMSAAVAGFAAGRLARAGAASDSGENAIQRNGELQPTGDVPGRGF